jgi:threonine aldolase
VSIKPVDLRSDTLTRPTAEMRAAMAAAEVGDDVYGEDPTVNRLQARIAELLGKEAALFVPSGSMSNQIAVRVHCQPGEEFLCETDCHIFNYEQAAYAQLFGIAVQTAQGHYGVLHLEDVVDRIRPDSALGHSTPTRLICLENTHNRGSGRIQPYEVLEEICGWAAEQGLARHLDGARLLNAVVATGIPAAQWAQHFDTVSICFSKGLGAPVGSALCGPRDLIKRAHRLRKVMGGGMRQVGILAAGALYALDHHVERLAEDHRHAQRLAETIRETPGLALRPDVVDTNIVIFEIDPELGSAQQFCQRLAQAGVLMNPTSRQKARAVTHLDVDAKGIERACAAIVSTVEALCPQEAVR